jgi:hypothetical protein
MAPPTMVNPLEGDLLLGTAPICVLVGPKTETGNVSRDGPTGRPGVVGVDVNIVAPEPVETPCGKPAEGPGVVVGLELLQPPPVGASFILVKTDVDGVKHRLAGLLAGTTLFEETGSCRSPTLSATTGSNRSSPRWTKEVRYGGLTSNEYHLLRTPKSGKPNLGSRCLVGWPRDTEQQ